MEGQEKPHWWVDGREPVPPQEEIDAAMEALRWEQWMGFFKQNKVAPDWNENAPTFHNWVILTLQAAARVRCQSR